MAPARARLPLVVAAPLAGARGRSAAVRIAAACLLVAVAPEVRADIPPPGRPPDAVRPSGAGSCGAAEVASDCVELFAADAATARELGYTFRCVPDDAPAMRKGYVNAQLWCRPRGAWTLARISWAELDLAGAGGALTLAVLAVLASAAATLAIRSAARRRGGRSGARGRRPAAIRALVLVFPLAASVLALALLEVATARARAAVDAHDATERLARALASAHARPWSYLDVSELRGDLVGLPRDDGPVVGTWRRTSGVFDVLRSGRPHDNVVLSPHALRVAAATVAPMLSGVPHVQVPGPEAWAALVEEVRELHADPAPGPGPAGGVVAISTQLRAPGAPPPRHRALLDALAVGVAAAPERSAPAAVLVTSAARVAARIASGAPSTLSFYREAPGAAGDGWPWEVKAVPALRASGWATGPAGARLDALELPLADGGLVLTIAFQPETLRGRPPKLARAPWPSGEAPAADGEVDRGGGGGRAGRRVPVVVRLPRLSIETPAFSLRDVLLDRNGGFPAAFGKALATSGVDVLHAASLTLSEAAAEAPRSDGRAGGQDASELTVDHPFVFYVRTAGTGAVVLMGQLNDPAPDVPWSRAPVDPRTGDPAGWQVQPLPPARRVPGSPTGERAPLPR